MNSRNLLLGLVALVAVTALVVGLMWQPTLPAPALKAAAPAPTPAAAPVAAPVKPARVAAPLAPVAAPMTPATESAPEANVAAASVDNSQTPADLKAAVADLIQVIDAKDMTAFVQNYFAPTMVETAMASANSRLPADATPEMRAKVEQILQQQMPQLIQQMTLQLTQNPAAQQQFEKMAEALKNIQNNAPVMNAAGDQATYKLESPEGADLPPSLIMVRRDGKWVMDMMSMVKSRATQTP